MCYNYYINLLLCIRSKTCFSKSQCKKYEKLEQKFEVALELASLKLEAFILLRKYNFVIIWHLLYFWFRKITIG